MFPSSAPLYRAESTIITRGLMALYDFKQGTGGQLLIDRLSVGADRSLTLGADTSVSTDEPAWTNAGLLFDGTDDYCNLAATYLTATSGITMEVVARVGSTNQSGTFISIGNTDSNGYGICINGSPDTVTGNKFMFLVGGVAWRDAAMNFADTSTWYHLVVVRDSSQWRPYRNGVAGTTFATGPNAPSGRLTVGARQRVTPATDRFLNGEIAFIAVRNAALTADEVLAQYQALRAIMSVRGITL